MLSVTEDTTEDAESNTDSLLDYPSLAGQLLFSLDPKTASSSWPACLQAVPAPACQPSRDRQSPATQIPCWTSPSLAGQLLFSLDPKTASSSWPALPACPICRPCLHALQRQTVTPQTTVSTGSADNFFEDIDEKGQTNIFYLDEILSMSQYAKLLTLSVLNNETSSSDRPLT